MTVNYLNRTWTATETGRNSAPYMLTSDGAQPVKLISGGDFLFPQRGLTVMPGLFRVVDGALIFVPTSKAKVK